MNTKKTFTLLELTVVIVLFLATVAWVTNIVKLLLWTSVDPISLVLILRIIGIFLPPLGIVMGYIPT